MSEIEWLLMVLVSVKLLVATFKGSLGQCLPCFWLENANAGFNQLQQLALW